MLSHNPFRFGDIRFRDFPDFFILQHAVKLFEKLWIDKRLHLATPVLCLFLTVEAKEGLVIEPRLTITVCKLLEQLRSWISLEELEEHATCGGARIVPFTRE